MDKLSYDIRLEQGSLDHLKMVEGQVKGAEKLARPVDWKHVRLPRPSERACTAKG